MKNLPRSALLFIGVMYFVRLDLSTIGYLNPEGMAETTSLKLSALAALVPESIAAVLLFFRDRETIDLRS